MCSFGERPSSTDHQMITYLHSTCKTTRTEWTREGKGIVLQGPCVVRTIRCSSPNECKGFEEVQPSYDTLRVPIGRTIILITYDPLVADFDGPREFCSSSLSRGTSKSLVSYPPRMRDDCSLPVLDARACYRSIRIERL